MNRTPSTPPKIATMVMEDTVGMDTAPSLAHIKRAGIVKIAPAAIDSPAEPIV